MLILIKADSLHFRKITEEEKDRVRRRAESVGLVTTTSDISFNVYGMKAHLFTLLYELSKSYDIEIM